MHSNLPTPVFVHHSELDLNQAVTSSQTKRRKVKGRSSTHEHSKLATNYFCTQLEIQLQLLGNAPKIQRDLPYSHHCGCSSAHSELFPVLQVIPQTVQWVYSHLYVQCTYNFVLFTEIGVLIRGPTCLLKNKDLYLKREFNIKCTGVWVLCLQSGKKWSEACAKLNFGIGKIVSLDV